MPTETDIRLRSWLDANQSDRERMSRSILSLGSHYTDVRPRHPLGGPDGGRDIEAVYNNEHVSYGAVGFLNGANDSKEQKKKIREKFIDDLNVALSAKPDLKAFVFMTNVQLTMGEQSEMIEEARKLGVDHCEILDRERLRIELDSPAGFFIRFQHLNIPLSEAEQASFLSRYGDRIQEVVSTGFQRIERTLNRVLFLQEANDILSGITVVFTLREAYPASEIGHFRAFVHLYLREIKHDIFAVWFGSTDRSDRFSHGRVGPPSDPPGIRDGIATGQWERHFKLSKDEQPESKDDPSSDEDEKKKYVSTGGGSSVGDDPVRMIAIHYSHDDALIRTRPRLTLRDLDDCMFLAFMNQSLADKLDAVEVYANGYKLSRIGPGDFKVECRAVLNDMPGDFSDEELKDGWATIRPANLSSSFHLRFSETTPRRMFKHEELPDLASKLANKGAGPS